MNFDRHTAILKALGKIAESQNDAVVWGEIYEPEALLCSFGRHETD